MKAEELMIGNWVQLCFEHKEGWFNARVTSILPDGKIDTDSPDKVEKKDYYFEPIPLTPEILEKAGFKHDFSSGVYDNYKLPNNWYISYCKHDMGKVAYGHKLGYWYHGEEARGIQYVHELQNLYFALTGHPLHLTL